MTEYNDLITIVVVLNRTYERIFIYPSARIGVVVLV